MRGTGCTARPPRAVTADTSNNWLRASRAHCTAASLSSHDDGEDDHLVKGAAELVAAAHVADRREVGLDHAGQLGAWARLGDDAHSDQSIQSILHDGGGDHADSLHGATSMMTVSVSVGDSSPQTYLGMRRSRAVTGHAAATAASAVRERKVFLHETGRTFTPSPVKVTGRIMPRRAYTHA